MTDASSASRAKKLFVMLQTGAWRIEFATKDGENRVYVGTTEGVDLDALRWNPLRRGLVIFRVIEPCDAECGEFKTFAVDRLKSVERVG